MNVLTSKDAWARIGELNATGELQDRFCSLVSEEGDPVRLAREVFGVPWWVMRKWIEGDAGRVADYEMARKAYADKLMYDSIKEVVGAEVETVQLAKLRADRFDRVAGKMDRASWGDGNVVGGGFGGITIVIGEVKVPELDVVEGLVIEQRAED